MDRSVNELPVSPRQGKGYVVPFAIIMKMLAVQSDGAPRTVRIEYERLLDAIRALVRAAPVDEDWYLRTYPDVAEAISEGQFKSAKHHFVANGYLEGRRPFDVQIDEAWYLATYPDVARCVEHGEIGSAREHFARHGYDEGRLPSEY